MKKYLFSIASVIVILAVLRACTNPTPDKDPKNPPTNPIALEMPLSIFKAVDMPSTLANGDAFPLDSTIIDAWLSKPTVKDGLETDPRVIGHAWGLWQALTEMTDQSYHGRTLRRFETWYTPQDVMTAMDQSSSLADLKRTDGQLQFRNKFKFGHERELSPVAGDISGKVKYSPPMAEQALAGKYFDESVLKAKIVEGEINTVSFKPNAVMLKPVYRVLTSMNAIADREDTYYFHLWEGKQDGGKEDSMFSKIIYVTTNTSDPAIDNVETFSIDAFIHHRMSEAEAYTYNNSKKEGQEFVGDSAVAGDPVIFLGCHVSTRETQRWTWQTFFWTESPDNPVFPSSSTIAAGRKNLEKPLTAPADHYAVSIGYSMMSPALPFTGPPVDIEEAGVSPVYALNPYIEGTFTTDVYPRQDSFYTGAYAKQFYTGNVDGITSSCMSCHSQSYFNGQTLSTAVQGFIADQYINRNAPWFKGSVQLDFAWSLFPGFEPKPSKVNEPGS